MSAPAIRLIVILVYFAIVLVIGALAFRSTQATAEDYFLGGRTAKTVVLFMALFGTNITPFVLMGIPGLAYHHGIAVFGLNAAIVVLGIPLSFWIIGYPAWIASKRLGVVTPAELYARRFDARWFGWLMFAVFFIYTVPYMVTAVAGVGIAVDVLSEGAIGFELAAAGILLITLAYTSLGGMKATMWTNVFQGAVFLGFSLLAFFLISDDLGGLSALMQRVQEASPQLFERPAHASGQGPFAPGAWASWALAIALTVIAFPHMLVRIFAAKDVRALKNACRYYPLAMIVLWVPAVLFGMWATVDHPGLVGRASDAVFPMLVLDHLGPTLQGVALAGILAAVMSTLDAQMLTLSSMLTRDVLPQALGERHPVRLGRLFLVGLAALTWWIVVNKPASIFKLAGVSFSGYVTLVPTLLLGLRWRRFTVWGATASLVLGNLVLAASFAGWIPGLGLLPVAWGLMAAIVGAVVGSLFSPPTAPSVVEAVIGPVERALRGG
ncbi:Na+/solute symporter [Enhygromyxa salina]|uniref:Na+/solute symporter n=1 Tax=Enhygromyxa salina TaxID=215803 RepID=A0A0C2CTS9_9BACT|nr:sodium:solute symporter family protein [Enhygromyxa salina]KIG13030.1 Na+/solute symporter [Enhygromyxa salina]